MYVAGNFSWSSYLLTLHLKCSCCTLFCVAFRVFILHFKSLLFPFIIFINLFTLCCFYISVNLFTLNLNLSMFHSRFLVAFNFHINLFMFHSILLCIKSTHAVVRLRIIFNFLLLHAISTSPLLPFNLSMLFLNVFMLNSFLHVKSFYLFSYSLFHLLLLHSIFSHIYIYIFDATLTFPLSRSMFCIIFSRWIGTIKVAFNIVCSYKFFIVVNRFIWHSDFLS